MQSANPVLTRIDKDAAQSYAAANGGPGFAYEEGRAAVGATTAAPAAFSFSISSACRLRG